MKIILARHGESDANVADFINDDPARPVNLTRRGREQARQAAERLKHWNFRLAYASEFPRARQTAEAILAYHVCPLVIDARLNERRSGMDGLPTAAFNELVRPDPVNIRPPAGESFLEQMERLRRFLDDAARREPEGPVLAVSHENPILAASALAGRPAREAACGQLPNCAWLELVWPA
jgi:broad specificity phosphatase PhoE